MNTTIQLENERSGSILPYACWVVFLALGFYNLVYAREVIVSILIVLEIDPKLFLVVDKVGFFFFGVIGLLIILLSEPYFRKGWQKELLGVRFTKVLALAFACLSVSWAVLLGLPGLAEEARPSIISLAAAAALLTITSALYRRQLRRSTA